MSGRPTKGWNNEHSPALCAQGGAFKRRGGEGQPTMEYDSSRTHTHTHTHTHTKATHAGANAPGYTKEHTMHVLDRHTHTNKSYC